MGRQIHLALTEFSRERAALGQTFSFDRILNRSPGVVLKSRTLDIEYVGAVGVDVAVAGYVDNFAAEGIDADVVTEVNLRIASKLRHCGLVVHEICDASPTAEFIGLSFNNGKISINGSKFWKTKAALDAILSRHKLSGAMLEIMLGSSPHYDLASGPFLLVSLAWL